MNVKELVLTYSISQWFVKELSKQLLTGLIRGIHKFTTFSGIY